ncbi:MAG: hypothetical protein WCH44_00200 [Betaproteobacteria bacterium]
MNIQSFLFQSHPNDLARSYGILVALELALKDGGHKAGIGGHDVPSMLGKAKQFLATSGQLVLAAQVSSFEAQLKNDLIRLHCTGQNGSAQSVPPHSYPYARYTRFQGDWAGVDETPYQVIADLRQTCQHILFFFRSNSVACGVSI